MESKIISVEKLADKILLALSFSKRNNEPVILTFEYLFSLHQVLPNSDVAWLIKEMLLYREYVVEEQNKRVTITAKGIDFVATGGYERELNTILLDEFLKISTIKNNKYLAIAAIISTIISVVALVISLIK